MIDHARRGVSRARLLTTAKSMLLSSRRSNVPTTPSPLLLLSLLLPMNRRLSIGKPSPLPLIPHPVTDHTDPWRRFIASLRHLNTRDTLRCTPTCEKTCSMCTSGEMERGSWITIDAIVSSVSVFSSTVEFS